MPDWVKWLFGILLAAIQALIALIYANLRGDVSTLRGDLRTDLAAMRKDLEAGITRLVSTIESLGTQLTQVRLDDAGAVAREEAHKAELDRLRGQVEEMMKALRDSDQRHHDIVNSLTSSLSATVLENLKLRKSLGSE